MFTVDRITKDFTDKKYNQIIDVLDKGKRIELGSSMAGNDNNNSNSVQIYSDSWMIDSVETNHMTNNSQLLNNLTKMHDPMKDSVQLPNGKTLPIQYQGNVAL